MEPNVGFDPMEHAFGRPSLQPHQHNPHHQVRKGEVSVHEFCRFRLVKTFWEKKPNSVLAGRARPIPFLS